MPFIALPEGAEPTEDGRYEVPSDAIEYGEDESPDGFLPQDAVESIVKSRLKRKERSLKSELQESDEFFQKAAAHRGIELREDGSPKGYVKDDEVKELRKTRAQYETLKSEHERLQNQIEQARDTELTNRLLRHAQGVKDDLQDAFLQLAKSRFTWDEDEGRHVLVGDDGDVRYVTEGGKAKPAGAKVLIDEMQESHPSFFKSHKMQGGPDTQPGGSSGKKNWTQDEYDAAAKRTHEMDEETYRDWESAPDEGRIID